MIISFFSFSLEKKKLMVDVTMKFKFVDVKVGNITPLISSKIDHNGGCTLLQTPAQTMNRDHQLLHLTKAPQQ